MFHAATMVDMAKAPEEIKEELAKTQPSAPAVPSSAPTYPYGLCISFDEESLEKLKMDGNLPAVGATFHFCAEARVTSVSQNEREGTDGAKETCQRVECQITRIGVPGASEGERSMQTSERRRAALYAPGDTGDDA